MAWLLIVAALAVGGCEGVRHVLVSANPAGQNPDQTPTARAYPEDLPIGPALDIEVVRADRKHIVLDNRTARPYHGAMLWVNEQWGGQIEQVPIGKGKPIALVNLINHHAEPFPVGSFLEPDQARNVVLADLVADGEVHKLLVRLPEDWQRR